MVYSVGRAAFVDRFKAVRILSGPPPQRPWQYAQLQTFGAQLHLQERLCDGEVAHTTGIDATD